MVFKQLPITENKVSLKKCQKCKKKKNAKLFRESPFRRSKVKLCNECYHTCKAIVIRNRNLIKISPKDARLLVLKHYGAICKCCGEKIQRFLELDHINNDGKYHRKELEGTNIYVWLVNNNFPEGYQILCMNCNRGKQLNNGICPHEELRQKMRLVLNFKK